MSRIEQQCGLLFSLIFAVNSFGCPARAAELVPLRLEAKIPLGDVRGRIDHLAFDSSGQRLFVAEYGNDSVGVVDTKALKLVKTVGGMSEPQDITYLGATNTVYVANGGDGTVRLLHGSDLAPIAQIALGEDADNIRIDEAGRQLFVGYASGAIAIIDAQTRSKIGDIPLKVHPEGFQLDAAGRLIYVNVPDAREIAVIDRQARKQIGSWKLKGAGGNFAMAIDDARNQVVVATRNSASLIVFSGVTGELQSEVSTCADADDVFIDAKRRRTYVSCGAGIVDVFESTLAGNKLLGSVPTAPGARTSLFLADLDRLFVAVRATSTEAAAIWIFRPQ